MLESGKYCGGKKKEEDKRRSKMVSIGLTGKVRAEQRLEGGEEVSSVDMWDNNCPDSHRTA